ncbi:hypothetical protein [Campylobacter magnus]|uniref:Uncharacterized protein n=1 Tax=Campylobacter magnus TaxID=3026462 RepID=A0ABT8T687_9BACT|nr:hypothetical protein [Campylobacter magnus]MDO2409205.1 hypothetical protein [Campylobacter magnus]
MNEKLTNYLEFLENSAKFKAMDKAQKAQMLSEINELIKSDALWVLNSRNDEIKKRVSSALFARLYSDIKDEILSKIKEQKFSIFSVFSKEPNQKYPKELKEHRKRGECEFAVAFGKGKDESGEAVFANTFIIFEKARCFIVPTIQKIARKYNCTGKYIRGYNRFKVYDALSDCLGDFDDTVKKNEIIDFDKNCEINLTALSKIIPYPNGLRDFAFTHAKVLFYERLCDEIISANRQVIDSITCYTARSLWSDNYDVSSYFKAPEPSNATPSNLLAPLKDIMENPKHRNLKWQIQKMLEKAFK